MECPTDPQTDGRGSSHTNTLHCPRDSETNRFYQDNLVKQRISVGSCLDK